MKKILHAYLTAILREDVSLAAYRAKNLPLIITSRYELLNGVIFGKNVCFACAKYQTTPLGYQKDINLILRSVNHPVVLVISDPSALETYRLIERGLDFVVPGKRMFMPSLLVDLGGQVTHKAKGQMPPTAQLIVLYHLQKGTLNGKSAKEISSLLSIPYLNASRALKWIGDNVFSLRKEGRKVLLSLPEYKETLEAFKPHFQNPVLKTIHTEESLESIDGPYCGEYALEHYSMLAANGISKAVEKGGNVPLDEDANAHNTVEIWAYNPKILANDGFCDKISLILSLDRNEDERVQMELVKIKEEIKW
ncbi:MAG: hypothetical protein IJR34_07835 [Bacteroidales bacterium]|nr:hypothetical protein [Bacteroidales bacterium]